VACSRLSTCARELLFSRRKSALLLYRLNPLCSELTRPIHEVRGMISAHESYGRAYLSLTHFLHNFTITTAVEYRSVDCRSQSCMIRIVLLLFNIHVPILLNCHRCDSRKKVQCDTIIQVYTLRVYRAVSGRCRFCDLSPLSCDC
jgi:hypothetical protein